MKANKQLAAVSFLFLSFLVTSVTAQEISVIDVRRNITLADTDTVYKDFYINAGDSSALRKNMIVNVKRKINVKDASTKSVGDIETVVGQVKIIHIGAKVSVAREHRLLPRDQEPMLEQIGIMAGDRVDLAGSFIDNSKPAAAPKSKKAAEVEVPVENPVEKPAENKTAEAVELVPQI